MNCYLCVNLLCLVLFQTMVPQPPPAHAPLQLTKVGPETQLALGDAGSFHRTRNQVCGARLIPVENSPVLIACWEETPPGGVAQSYYAISLDGRTMATVRPTSYVLKLRQNEFDPLVRPPPIAAHVAGDRSTQVYIVQFVAQPLPDFRSAIEVRGGTIYKFLANHAYLVKMSPTVRDAVAALPFVRWVGAYHPAYRMEEVLRDPSRSAELPEWQAYNIQVFEAGDLQKKAVAQRLEALGGRIDVRDAGKFLLRATLTPEQARTVAHWDEVAFLDHWGPGGADMDKIRVVGGADYVEQTAGFTGAGVRGEVLDAGFNYEHVDFASRPLIQHTPAPPGYHGASCSGIIFGDGTGDPTARGLCPEGQGIVADFNTYAAGSRYDYTAQLLQAPYFAVFQSCSMGGEWTLDYTTTSADMDTMLFDLNIVHCQSQANHGSQSSRPQAWAKNIISCGGVQHYDTLDLADDCWCNYASIGPAADGRIKPDLCYFVDYIHTVEYPGPTTYTDIFGGTSGATPTVAGHVGLFFQMWSEGVFGNEVDPDGTVFENRAHLSTAKAFLINTADQYPFEGATHDLTRVHQGWGRPSVQNLWDLREKVFFVDETELLSPLETYSVPLVVAEDEPALRCTLAYTDSAGLPSSSQARINDLSLRVISPSGVLYWGNNGLLVGNWSEPGGEANTIDTVENVFVPDPEPGIWTVEVIASEINEDGHVETPQLDADFALVVTGIAHNPLTINLPDGVPTYLPPHEPTAIVVQIRDGAEAYMPGSGTLHYSFDGGDFHTQTLTDLGSGLYEAVLPAAACGAVPRFYFSAAGSAGTVVYNPPQAPDFPYTATVGVVVVALDDNFEQDLGWTVWSDPSLTGGMWQRGVPLTSGVQGQPPTVDFDHSGKCYLTQNTAGNSDVDGGPTRLTSPLLDLTDLPDPVLQFARWWANDDQDGDPFDVEASSDGGATWVLMRRIQNVQPAWVRETIHLADFIPLTDEVQLRFSARDVPNNSIDEGGLDAVIVSAVTCTGTVLPGDLNCDGLINAFDIDPFVLALTDPAAYAEAYSDCPIQNADCNGDGLVNAFDIDPFVVCLTEGCAPRSR
jgi:hypothetical protein